MYDEDGFTPSTVQSIHASDDGLLFVQIQGDVGAPGHEVDVFNVQEGRYLGSFELPLPIQPLSESDFRNGHFTYLGVGDLDVPVLVQTRLGAR